MSARENILGRVRTSLRRTENDGAAAIVRAHIGAHAMSPRPNVAGDLVARFREKALALSTTLSNVPDRQSVPAAVAAYLSSNALPMNAVCWKALGDMDWANHGVAMEARPARESDKVGITEVFCAIAETGTLMTLSGTHTPPVTSLLPETHIAVLRESQIVPGMEEAWQRLRETPDYPPRAVNFISGPSRTSDIEQTLTLGAHGPYRVHIILVHA
ncbi:MAG: lactate utilization protein C [Burkholderiales bacterium]